MTEILIAVWLGVSSWLFASLLRFPGYNSTSSWTAVRSLTFMAIVALASPPIVVWFGISELHYCWRHKEPYRCRLCGKPIAETRGECVDCHWQIRAW